MDDLTVDLTKYRTDAVNLGAEPPSAANNYGNLTAIVLDPEDVARTNAYHAKYFGVSSYLDQTKTASLSDSPLYANISTADFRRSPPPVKTGGGKFFVPTINGVPHRKHDQVQAYLQQLIRGMRRRNPQCRALVLLQECNPFEEDIVEFCVSSGRCITAQMQIVFFVEYSVEESYYPTVYRTPPSSAPGGHPAIVDVYATKQNRKMYRHRVAPIDVGVSGIATSFCESPGCPAHEFVADFRIDDPTFHHASLFFLYQLRDPKPLTFCDRKVSDDQLDFWFGGAPRPKTTAENAFRLVDITPYDKSILTCYTEDWDTLMNPMLYLPSADHVKYPATMFPKQTEPCTVFSPADFPSLRDFLEMETRYKVAFYEVFMLAKGYLSTPRGEVMFGGRPYRTLYRGMSFEYPFVNGVFVQKNFLSASVDRRVSVEYTQKFHANFLYEISLTPNLPYIMYDDDPADRDPQRLKSEKGLYEMEVLFAPGCTLTYVDERMDGTLKITRVVLKYVPAVRVPYETLTPLMIESRPFPQFLLYSMSASMSGGRKATRQKRRKSWRKKGRRKTRRNRPRRTTRRK